MHFGEANRSLPSINNRDGLLFKSPSPTRQCIFLCPPPTPPALPAFTSIQRPPLVGTGEESWLAGGRGRLSNGNSRRAGWRRRRGSMTGVRSHSIHLFDMHQGEGQYIFASPLSSNANSLCFDSFVGTWNYKAQCPQEAFLRLPWLVELSLNGGYMHTCWTQSKWRIYAHGRSPYFGCSILCTTRPSLTAVAGTQPVSVLSSEHQPEICYL
jgi:hypothetical protein